MGFTELLKSNRKRMGLTQRKLSETLDVSQTAVYLWESGRANPSMENIVRLEQLFETPKGELLIPLAYAISAERGVAR
jgi:transcriptional regulator with XRE-family HTH domain